MLSTVANALIQLAVLVLCYFVILWVLGVLGITIPAMVAKVILVILVLFGVVIIARAFGV